MMKNLFLLALTFLVISCGSDKGGSQNESGVKDQNSINSELTAFEKILVAKLLSLGFIEQKKLVKEILLLPDLEEVSLKKLDLYLKIECTANNGLCQIERKEKK